MHIFVTGKCSNELIPPSRITCACTWQNSGNSFFLFVPPRDVMEVRNSYLKKTHLTLSVPVPYHISNFSRIHHFVVYVEIFTLTQTKSESLSFHVIASRVVYVAVITCAHIMLLSFLCQRWSERLIELK